VARPVILNPYPGSAADPGVWQDSALLALEIDEDDIEEDTHDFLLDVDADMKWTRPTNLHDSIRPAPSPKWLEMLRDRFLAAGLSARSLAAFVAELRPAAFFPGDVIVTKRSLGDRAFIIEAGAVDAMDGLRGGPQRAVARLWPGRHFGFVTLAVTQSWLVSMVAAPVGPAMSTSAGATCRCLYIDRADFSVLAAAEPLLLEASRSPCVTVSGHNNLSAEAYWLVRSTPVSTPPPPPLRPCPVGTSRSRRRSGC
jgi:hypothetical protein